MASVDLIQSVWNIIKRTLAHETESEASEPSYIGVMVRDSVTGRDGKIEGFAYSPYGEIYAGKDGNPLLDENGQVIPIICAYVVGEGWADWLICESLDLIVPETARAA